MALEPDFWKNKPLDELNSEEWEALCDGCGKCCLFKLIEPGDEKCALRMSLAAIWIW